MNAIRPSGVRSKWTTPQDPSGKDIRNMDEGTYPSECRGTKLRCVRMAFIALVVSEQRASTHTHIPLTSTPPRISINGSPLRHGVTLRIKSTKVGLSNRGTATLGAQINETLTNKLEPRRVHQPGRSYKVKPDHSNWTSPTSRNRGMNSLQRRGSCTRSGNSMTKWTAFPLRRISSNSTSSRASHCFQVKSSAMFRVRSFRLNANSTLWKCGEDIVDKSAAYNLMAPRDRSTNAGNLISTSCVHAARVNQESSSAPCATVNWD